MPQQKFPKEVYLIPQGEPGSSEQYFSVVENVEGFETIDESTPCAKYQLVEKGKLVVTRIYENTEPGGGR